VSLNLSDLGSISPAFYSKHLRTQIPKAQKIQSSVFFALLGSAYLKALSKMLVKLTPCRRSAGARMTTRDRQTVVLSWKK